MSSSRLMKISKTQMQAPNNCSPIIHQFHSDNTKPYFFKLIVNPIDQKHHLRIPMEFVKKYGKHLSDDDISLNVPNSEQPWKVKLEKDSNNNMFLGKGWPAFMEFYAMEFGNVLVFRFDGGSQSQSQFHVFMFDKTAVEIDYPVRINSSDVVMMTRKTDEEGDVSSIEMLDQIYSPKLNKNIETVNVDTSDSDDDDEVKCSSYKGKGCINSHTSKKEILRKLDDFNSPHPHFKAIMHPSHVDHRYRRGVPFNHATKYFTSESKKIILRGPNGKPHRVRYYLGKKTAELQHGWRNFALDNQLRVGDACVFELIHPRSNSYEVTIFRCIPAS